MITKEQVIEKLKKVQDPELGLDVWTLGLIYDIALEKTKVLIKMTLTTPMCPYGPMMIADVEKEVKSLKGVTAVKVDITFNPPWKPNDEIRELLGV